LYKTLAGLVFGVLSGFDRLMFRGHLRELAYPGGMLRYCNFNGVRLTGFKTHAEQMTARLLEASEAQAKQLGRPIEYLASPKLRKEDHARSIAQRDGIRDGLIALFKCVEPCWSFALRGNRATKKLELKPELRKVPAPVPLLSAPVVRFLLCPVADVVPVHDSDRSERPGVADRQLAAAGLDYRRHDNCVTWVEDVPRAQALLDGQLRVNWAKLLGELGSGVHRVIRSCWEVSAGLLLVAEAVGVGQRRAV